MHRTSTSTTVQIVNLFTDLLFVSSFLVFSDFDNLFFRNGSIPTKAFYDRCSSYTMGDMQTSCSRTWVNNQQSMKNQPHPCS